MSFLRHSESILGCTCHISTLSAYLAKAAIFLRLSQVSSALHLEPNKNHGNFGRLPAECHLVRKGCGIGRVGLPLGIPMIKGFLRDFPWTAYLDPWFSFQHIFEVKGSYYHIFRSVTLPTATLAKDTSRISVGLTSGWRKLWYPGAVLASLLGSRNSFFWWKRVRILGWVFVEMGVVGFTSPLKRAQNEGFVQSCLVIMKGGVTSNPWKAEDKVGKR